MPVRGQLNAVSKAVRYILHERLGVFGIAPAYQPGHSQLGIGINGRPCPNVPDPRHALEALGDVLLLRIDEGPDFIALDTLGG
jgi:hypothetical protein